MVAWGGGGGGGLANTNCKNGQVFLASQLEQLKPNVELVVVTNSSLCVGEDLSGQQ